MISAVLLLVLVAGCGSDDRPGRDDDAVAGELRVSAAASLTDAFAAVGAAFEQVHPAVDVVLNLAGSATLREQVLEGAPVDVLAAANRATMDAVVERGAVAEAPRPFASNRLEIAVPSGNPAAVSGIADFADENLLLGLCAEGVPCGDLAREALAAADVDAAVDTNEPDVRALATKVAEGELDAGIVYATDVAALSERVDGVAVAAPVGGTARYPIAALREAPNPPAAAAFVSFVLSDPGQAILRDHGFAPPPPS